MATYTVKIVDHTKSDEFQKYKGGIKRLAQERFDEAFKDTSDTVTVSWGNGTEKDDLVMHFVQDVDHSFIKTKWPKAQIALMPPGTHIPRTRCLAQKFMRI